MWRRIYLGLLVVRLYFALCPSYIHPDEHFQGPEIVAGDVFNWQVTKTWEFTVSTPIRSIFPLWAVYGLPMQILQWITTSDSPSPTLIYYTLRILFSLASFVLEDWALQELVTSPRARPSTLLLIASSYVTWTYQTHTFSNSVETIAVVWSLVLIKRISSSKDSALISSGLLGSIAVFGVFNRITFLGFIFLPAFRLIRHFIRYPFALAAIIFFAFITAHVGIYLDTIFYAPSTSEIPRFFTLLASNPIITPFNNLLYNIDHNNLSLHGIHPRYNHLLINLPQLLGPALLSVLTTPHLTLPLLSAISGISALSIFQHQEARFLIPSIPLILSSINIPRIPILRNTWIVVWIAFNSVLGVLMGIYHQGGVVPAQTFISENLENATTVIWWKTYSPPTWLLGNINERIDTIDLKGSNTTVLQDTIAVKATCNSTAVTDETYLLAPLSLFPLPHSNSHMDEFIFSKQWEYKSHLGLDDLDIDLDRDGGVVGVVRKVWDERGLGMWKVHRAEGECDDDGRYRGR